uniref:Zinc finger protein 654 n=1 Tax=Hippocampus comes TaxID=109280 RepID=A0A3Q2Y0T2_HIPCM
MADSESDVETDGLELALESLCSRYCSDVSAIKSKDYCSDFCELVEAYTGQWQVPLPQLKVLQTALCSFTKATARFPDDCQHVHNILSRLALSIFELLLFFSKEEFGEKPLKDILDSYQACHIELLRHRNVYLQHARLIIKAGGPWENQVLQAILKETELPPKEVDDYLSSELPVFLELRIRYLQACERIKEAMALAKVCLENHKPGKHLYLHQAYLTCLYKASLHEHLHKQIICNTEQIEKDELLLSLCKVFLAQQLHNGDMYYIWDLAFIWSRLHLRTHPSMRDFLTECTRLAYSAKNVRAIFPFIKLVSAELGRDGVQVCMELCARALQLCDEQADDVAQSLVCKTIAFLLPGDLEICRACALLVFCLERSLEAYRTVRLLYKHPDQETHPHRSLVPTNVRFKIMQMLKGRLSFDPEFWSILALRTRCLELIDDKVMKDALINEMSQEEEEEEEECCDEALTSTCVTDFYAQHLNPSKSAGTKSEKDFYCHPCKKNYKGLNVLRHFIAHFKRRNRCIICGKCFQHLVVGKKHIWEHIEEMCKNHKDAEAEGAQTTNGTTSNQLEAPNENQTPIEEPRKKLSKVKVSSLSREDRIMRNLRIALRKLQAQSKKLNKDAAAVPLDFEDEQVVIQDDLVIIKAPAAAKQGEADAAGENGYDAVGKYVLCPSSSCDRVFLKHGSNLTKHAVRSHLNDDQVLEKTFVWAKHKCTFCSRNFQFVQYYKEHIRRHDPLLPHFCFHVQCDQRFLTSQELRAHMSTHDPFSAMCAFANCNKQFSDIINLFDHEWRHYVPPPQRDDLGRQQRQSDEAPWKQRVKVEERWSQSKQINQEKPGVVKTTSGILAVEANAPDSAEVCLKAAEPIQKPINGFEEAKQCQGPKGSKRAASKKAHHKKKFRFTCRNPVPDPLNVKDMEKNTTMAEGVDSKWEEPLIAQHKTFNPQEPTYAPFYKTYFTRLPPSTYMDESQLSMRKRRAASKGKREQKIRHRCEKCLSSFDSVQELQNHKALNTCSALFGFDSDDES